ncbi:MAG TPA: hypothetical protein VGQ03_08340 [Nitrososphaera sp.]|jgi:hypothetical protein|nr:hypothetical protein [Nitrososphaera sp.]
MQGQVVLIAMLVISVTAAPAYSTIFKVAEGHTPNHAPVINGLTNGQVFTFEAGEGIVGKISFGASDSDGDFVNIANTPLPSGAFYEFVEQFEGVTGASITFLDGTPFVGEYSVTFTAVDEHGSQSTPVTIQIVVSPPDYLDITFAKIHAGQKNAMMTIKVEGDVTPNIQRPPYGFAALTEDGNGILAVATHAGLLDSEDQDHPGDDIIHTHAVDVVPSTDCVNGIKIASASFESPGKLVVDTNRVKVSKAPSESFGDFDGTVISFILTVENGNICINPVDSFVK